MTTYIVGFNTKKEFKQRVKDRGFVEFCDPSIQPGARSGNLNDFIRWGYTFWTVTNTKRSWFAEVTVKRDGKVIVR